MSEEMSFCIPAHYLGDIYTTKRRKKNCVDKYDLTFSDYEEELDMI